MNTGLEELLGRLFALVMCVLIFLYIGVGG